MKMSKQEFFPPRPAANPTIYAYKLEDVSTHEGLLKIGFTVRNAKKRVEEQVKTTRLNAKIVLEESAMRNDGSSFTDIDVHHYLTSHGVKQVNGEWFKKLSFHPLFTTLHSPNYL